MTHQKATMVTIEGRPTPVLHKLHDVDEVLVQCRHSNGEDVYVPLKEVFSLFVEGLATALETKQEKRDGTQ